MGYNTDFVGRLNLDKALTDEQVRRLKDFADADHDDEKGMPGKWCQWVPTDDGEAIEWDGNEKFYNYEDWLQYLIENFLTPWGCTLSGTIVYRGDSSEDCGTITVSDGVVTKISYERHNEQLEQGLDKVLSLVPEMLPLLMGINETVDAKVKKLLKGE